MILGGLLHQFDHWGSSSLTVVWPGASLYWCNHCTITVSWGRPRGYLLGFLLLWITPLKCVKQNTQFPVISKNFKAHLILLMKWSYFFPCFAIFLSFSLKIINAKYYRIQNINRPNILKHSWKQQRWPRKKTMYIQTFTFNKIFIFDRVCNESVVPARKLWNSECQWNYKTLDIENTEESQAKKTYAHPFTFK